MFVFLFAAVFNFATFNRLKYEHVNIKPNFCRDINKKREDFLDWSEYFMSVAFLAAKRSKDPCSQVGACIVNKEKKIVGTGYNGMPHGCSDDDFPWSKEAASNLDTKFFYGEFSYLFISVI